MLSKIGGKEMRKVIQFAFATLLWGIVIILFPQLTIKVFGVALLPMVCAIFAMLGTIFPKLFAMGVQGFKNANIFERLIPVVAILLICCGIRFMAQTYASAFFISTILGNTTSYVGFLVGDIYVKRKGKDKR